MSVMHCCRVSDFGEKEVINLSDGCRLGCVIDVLFQVDTGQIEAIIVPGRKEGFSLFEKRLEIEIPWCNIDRIGDDFIFVRFNTPPPRVPPRRRGFFD